MSEYDLSPFSSPEVLSVSPKCRKTLSPHFKDEKEKKKSKSKPLLFNEKHSEKKKGETFKR